MRKIITSGETAIICLTGFSYSCSSILEWYASFQLFNRKDYEAYNQWLKNQSFLDMAVTEDIIDMMTGEKLNISDLGKAFDKTLIKLSPVYGFFEQIYIWLAILISSPSIVLNAFLIYFTLSVKDLRSCTFFPIVAQAAVGIISNLAFFNELLVFMLSNVSPVTGTFSHDDKLFSVIRSYFMDGPSINGFSKTVMFMEKHFTKYAISIGSLSMAIERYLATCRPFIYKTYLSKSLDKVQCLILCVAMVLPVLGLLAVRLVNFSSPSKKLGVVDETQATRFFYFSRDVTISQKVIETIAYFAVPTIASFVLYRKVFTVLRNMKTQQKQNKILTRIMAGIWLVSLVLCTPYHIVSLRSSHLRTWGSTFKTIYFCASLLDKIYLQVTPILMIIVCAPYKQKLQHIFQSVADTTMSCFCDATISNDVDEVALHVIPGTSYVIDGTAGGSNEKTARENQWKNRNMMFVCLLLALLFLSILSTGFSCSTLLSIPKTFDKFSKVQFNVQQFRSLSTTTRQKLQGTIGTQHQDPRLSCDESGGDFNWQFRMCLMLIKDNIERNFQNQKEDCNSRNAVMAYPRTMKEANFMREYYRTQARHCSYCSPIEVWKIGF